MGALKRKRRQTTDDMGFTGWEVDTNMRGQWLIAVLAALLSMVIHAAMAWVASRVDFSYLMRDPYDVPSRRFETMRIDRVELPEDVSPILETLRAFEPSATVGVDLRAPLESLPSPPDAAAIEPPAMRAPEAELDLDALAEVEPPSLEIAWQPRQEILAIETRAVVGPDLPLPRREIPAIERVPDAPDIVLPIAAADIPDFTDRDSLWRAPSLGGIPEGVGPLPPPSAIFDDRATAVATQPQGTAELFEEAADEITDAEPIERTLTAQVETFRLPGESHGYFRLTIDRLGADVLPVMPKDILFVQDTSATIAERRLHFSREGFRRGFAYVGAQDRFNIATFIDHTTYAFPDWTFRTAEADEKARQYLSDMVIEGNTDFLTAMRDILALETDPERPVIVIVVTDGLLHSGITDNTEVIARFTRENAGRMSIFAFGVADYANMYLLEMLSKFNMGDATYVQSGRWDIPDALQALIRSVSRPVLGDLRVRFGVDTEVDGFPLRPGNLYLDRPLVLYGRYPLHEERLVFHAAGRARGQRSDMVFDLAYPELAAGAGDATIRDGWSQQKMYSLIALYTETRDRSYLREMSGVARKYGQPIPFRTFFGL